MSGFDARTPSIARLYDFWLGGKDNFAADRELGERLLELYPATAEIVRENKGFLTRAVTWVANQGVAQFIDLGAGMPTSPNTLETAAAVVPGARVACVDNDPVVVAHLHALLEKGTPGVTVVDGDVREADAVLNSVAGGIDFGEPACVVMGSLLHFFPPDVARDMLRRYAAPLVSGSYLIVSVGRSDGDESDRFISMYEEGGSRLYYYSQAEITELLSPYEVMPPGITEVRVWRPGWTELPVVRSRSGDVVGAVARVR